MNITEFFQLHKRVAVAFSGGVDSAVLLLLAKKHAEHVKAYYVKSAFQPQFEYDDALEIARLLDVGFEVITADVLSDTEVTKNPSDRCYYCKKRIFSEIIRAAEKDGIKEVLEGTNASDNTDERPGFRALKELGVLSPLRECVYTKSDIRKIARENSLPVADKPSYACLATRIPTDTVITEKLLEKTENAEDILFSLGFKNFRVRYLDGAAKLELDKDGFELLYRNKDAVTEKLKPLYSDIYLDLKERTDE